MTGYERWKLTGSVFREPARAASSRYPRQPRRRYEISISIKLLAALRNYARAHRRSVSSIVEEAVREITNSPVPPPRRSTLSISAKTYERLQARARADRTPIAAIIERLLSDLPGVST